MGQRNEVHSSAVWERLSQLWLPATLPGADRVSARSFWRQRETAACDNAQDYIEPGAVLGGEAFVYSIWVCFGQFVYSSMYKFELCSKADYAHWSSAHLQHECFKSSAHNSLTNQTVSENNQYCLKYDGENKS